MEERTPATSPDRPDQTTIEADPRSITRPPADDSVITAGTTAGITSTTTAATPPQARAGTPTSPVSTTVTTPPPAQTDTATSPVTTANPPPTGTPTSVPSIGRPNYIPFVAIILLLILSNIMFALEFFEDDDDDDDDPDPNGGNGTVIPREQIISDLTVFQSYELIQNNTNNLKFVILDVRAASDFKREWIEGAINIDYFNDSYDRYIRILDRNLTYLLYCDGGGISSLVQDDMEALGYLEVYHMLNGIDRWKELGYETEGGDS